MSEKSLLELTDKDFPNKDKLNTINFNASDLPEHWFKFFLRDNEERVKLYGEGITVSMMSDHYHDVKGQYAFMICYPVSLDGMKYYCAYPFIFTSLNHGSLMSDWMHAFADKKTAIDYTSKFVNIHSGDEMDKMIKTNLSQLCEDTSEERVH